MSGGLNAGHNHSSPNGEGVTLCTVWLGVRGRVTSLILKISLNHKDIKDTKTLYVAFFPNHNG